MFFINSLVTWYKHVQIIKIIYVYSTKINSIDRIEIVREGMYSRIYYLWIKIDMSEEDKNCNNSSSLSDDYSDSESLDFLQALPKEQQVWLSRLYNLV